MRAVSGGLHSPNLLMIKESKHRASKPPTTAAGGPSAAIAENIVPVIKDIKISAIFVLI